MSQIAEAERSRTVTWEDPLIGAAAARTMSGLDYIQAMIRGEVPAPPIAHLMGFSIDEVSEGHATFSVEPAEYHYNPIGVVHGGLASTLLDSALGCAVHTALPAGVGYTTIELHINLLRPLTAQTGRVQAIGEVIHLGRSVATAQAKLVDEKGKLYAHATTTCMIFRPEGG